MHQYSAPSKKKDTWTDHQARELFAKRVYPMLKGIVATTPEEAKAAAEIGGLTVEALQVKTGAVAVRLAALARKVPEELTSTLRRILGMDIKGHTKFTAVLVADAANIAKNTTSPSCWTAQTAPTTCVLGRRRYGSETAALSARTLAKIEVTTRWSAWIES